MERAQKTASDDTTQRRLVEVARLYYDENLSQQAIADRLGVSRSSIAHFLQHARETGIVRIEIVDPENACAELESELKKATGVERITVLPNPRGPRLLSLRTVAGAAARFLADSLEDADTFGLAWGRTMGMVVDLLEPSHARGLDVVPLMGEGCDPGFHSQMSQLVKQAADRLGATAHFLPLPLVVSSSDLRRALFEEAVIRETIDHWDHLDLVYMGIGMVPPGRGMVGIGIGNEHIPRLVDAGVVGSLCWFYYNEEGEIVETGLEDRIIATGLDTLREIDSIVAVASGAEKAVAVLGALRTSLISSLFIDQEMAEKILARLDATTPGGKRTAASHETT